MSLKFPCTAPRAAAFCVAVLALAGLASCGGSQVTPFEPTRILAFGDQASVIEADGRKYSINAFKVTNATTTPPTESTTLVDCTRNPLWIQTVATGFGLAFERCLGTATVASGQILAQPGHKVADLEAQIAAVQGGALNEKDLALVLVGMNDILEQYQRYPATTRDELLAELRTRGTLYGAQVNRLATAGPAVVVLAVPDLGLTPYALAQKAAFTDIDRAALLTEMTSVYNNSMSIKLINDGRLIGLLFADIDVQNMVKFPTTFSLTNVIAAACQPSAVLPACTSATLVDGATSARWLWADGLNLGPNGQARLGALALSRAKTNPF